MFLNIIAQHFEIMIILNSSPFFGVKILVQESESKGLIADEWQHKTDCTVREGVKKKSCNIVTTYVGGRMGNYTKFIYFFHGPNSSKSAKKFFCWWGLGVGGMVGR